MSAKAIKGKTQKALRFIQEKASISKIAHKKQHRQHIGYTNELVLDERFS